ncbi:MauE/DoxX family redox-associated membrane protein [uncultured Algoriphagus sp.]|uniref:MauE/DoxX family redox-associated membrane protein n=1 Tax=uncultured Algoriphagus sp. TaxID=417365 RepID=UPI002599897E|nr:MauE/DoxX family redox-associated membrane protein [uncultured Algoriphagus sp.]
MENLSPIKLLPSYLLAFLWTYTGLDKLIRFEQSRKAFHNQTFPAELADVLSYAVPLAELLLAILLVFQITRWWGYLGSILLLTVFITYVGLIWVGAFPRVPCNCAGLIDSMGWREHLILNSAFLVFAIWGLKMDYKKQKEVRSKT